ncbi:MAG TPA: arylesterase [Thermoanaerobaculia bacterium]|jgi:acyl-CoA thioesterase-1
MFVIPAVVPVLGACGAQDSRDAAAGVTHRAVAVSNPAPAAPVGGLPVVVFLGDSLTAGLGVDESQAYPALLDRQLREEGKPVRVINAGVSGDTTAGGLSRLGWLLDQHPDLVVVALGANDGLRALPLAEVETNLREIVRRSRAAGARVLLLGMRIPPNYGPYADQFAALYPKLAKELNVPLVPFLLEGVGGVRSLNQADGLHPTAQGQEIVAKTVRPYLERAIVEKPKAGL